jgi:hypothetical protein
VVQAVPAVEEAHQVAEAAQAQVVQAVRVVEEAHQVAVAVAQVVAAKVIKVQRRSLDEKSQKHQKRMTIQLEKFARRRRSKNLLRGRRVKVRRKRPRQVIGRTYSPAQIQQITLALSARQSRRLMPVAKIGHCFELFRPKDGLQSNLVGFWMMRATLDDLVINRESAEA